VPLQPSDLFSRPTAGGGGCGDPLERDPEKVKEDVADDYVSIERAAMDYGVILKVIDKDLCAYEVDPDATERERASIRAERRAWLEEEPEAVAAKYRAGAIGALDAVRRYAVILDWGSGELMPKSTAQFRERFRTRSLDHWAA
jgi:N-methylhydantoinase B